MFCDRFWPGLPLKSRYSLPEEVEHGIRGRVPVMGSTVRLATCNHVYPCGLLLGDSRLHDPVLCVGHVLWEQLPHCDESVERFIPARDAISANHGRRVFRVLRHPCPH